MFFTFLNKFIIVPGRFPSCRLTGSRRSVTRWRLFLSARRMRIVLFGIGNLCIQFVAYKLMSRKSLDHPAGIGLLDVEQRVAGHQVDTAHVDTLTGDRMVKDVDEVSCKESVAFSGIDIYACHAPVGGTAVFFFGRYRLVLILASTSGRLLVDIVDFRRILVVFEQTIELKRQYACLL